MDVIRAKSAGMCYGVKRALDLATECASQGKSAQTLGPLIHNPGVVQELEQQGVSVVDSVDDISAERIILRSHGVTPEVSRKVQASGCEIIDATCPHVLRAQKAAHKMASEGLTVLIVGESNHPEVKGLKAWAEDAGGIAVVVNTPADIPDSLQDPVGIVVQTTQPAAALDAVLAEVELRGLNPQVSNTICNATTSRQDAAKDLAAQVDAMVVVGGKNSSNTKRLFEICQHICPRTFHVEDASELRKEVFTDCQTVGVTAGASTPDAQIVAVEDILRCW